MSAFLCTKFKQKGECSTLKSDFVLKRKSIIKLKTTILLMTVESELEEIKKQMNEISKKLDNLLSDRDAIAMLKLSELSLQEFLDNEPNLYSLEDIKVRYQ